MSFGKLWGKPAAGKGTDEQPKAPSTNTVVTAGKTDAEKSTIDVQTMTFQLTLEKTSDTDEKLGLTLSLNDQKVLPVKEVKDQGLVPTHNAKSTGVKVQPGDTIIDINGHSGDSALMMKQLESKKIQLTIKRDTSLASQPAPELASQQAAVANPSTEAAPEQATGEASTDQTGKDTVEPSSEAVEQDTKTMPVAEAMEADKEHDTAVVPVEAENQSAPEKRNKDWCHCQ